MRQRSVKKGEILQVNGAYNSKIYVVKSGLLRSYFIDKKGKEHVFMFAPEGWIVADLTAPDTPTDLFIDALEDSLVLEKVKDVQEEKDVQKLINRLAILQQRIILLMSAPALERYQHFLTTYPDIVKRVPQRMIASYLGVTPEALSTLKKTLNSFE